MHYTQHFQSKKQIGNHTGYLSLLPSFLQSSNKTYLHVESNPSNTKPILAFPKLHSP